MPNIYKYLGIVIKLYTHDHDPIHFHAVYSDGAEVRISLYERDGVVHTVRYEVLKGNISPAKMDDLKTFVSKHKNALLLAYNQIKGGSKFKTIEITKRIK